MSADHTPETTRPRRRGMTTVSVALAVLLAGGGGAYWASTASGGGPAEAARDGADGRPSPLVLDGYGGQPPAGRGVAPGEPAPGGGPLYKAARPLPKGPERAPAYRIVVDVDRKEVARLAEALEVPGDVRERDGVWTAGGEGRSLTVDGTTGAWSFTGTVPLKAGDVSEKEAKEAAAPVVEALGLEDAEVDAGRTRGGLRIVRVEPRQDGLPVDGRATEIGVGGRGALASGSGLLAGAAKAGGGAEYPVMSAGDTLAALNERSGRVELGLRCSDPSGGGADKGLDKGPGKDLDKDLGKGAVEPGPGKPGAGGPDVVPPADGDPEGPGGAGGAGPCGPSGKRETVEVTDASFGLSAYPSEGRELLVPSWLFEVAAPGGEPYTVAHPAVEPEYLAPSGGDGAESAPAGPGAGPEEPARTATRVDEYGPGDRTLTVHFWGGVCSDYTASAEETGETVTIRISEKERNPGRACVAVAKAMTAEVALEKPVGDRKVLDEEGEPLPEGDPAEERR
ncbi:hypothetical protein GCM10010420_47690 [Streptomyces glaucosporus]|uniref:Large membrane protein n=1 Tax=Streptomyces glaucosporus TaxID=284044 RepID=A0ABP5VW09_9ACTN